MNLKGKGLRPPPARMGGRRTEMFREQMSDQKGGKASWRGEKGGRTTVTRINNLRTKKNYL